MTSRTPRGIRNNNPLNIRIGNTWLGERPNPTDDEFEEFISMECGLRAAFVILKRYIRRYQRDTIQKIIKSWAPSGENNTTAYIKAVCKTMNLDADQTIKYEDEDTMCLLVQAMAKVECGVLLPLNQIHKGYKLA